MATLIKLRRKKSTGNAGVTLAAGEAYYNLVDRNLFVGNKADESVSTKKHIAQITNLDTSNSATIKFQIGEDTNNVFTKTISAGNISGTFENSTNAKNVTDTISDTAISTLFNISNGKLTSAKKATTAVYADDDAINTIGSRIKDVQDTVEDITSGDAAVPKATKADSATNATTANDLKNLTLTSNGATITIAWGTNKSRSTTIAMDKVSGTVENATNVTTYLDSVALTDIFENDKKTAKVATQLATARDIRVALDSTAAASFDGSAAVYPGVSGTLPITSGGTGAGTASGALKNLEITVPASTINYLEGVNSNVQTQLNGKAATSHGTHVTYSTATPIMSGTATTGTANNVARGDHVHPVDTSRAAKDHTHKYAGSSSEGGSANSAVKLDTSAGSLSVPVYFSSGKPVACSGTLNLTANAATKLSTARTITLSGDVTGSVSFDGSKNVTIETTVAGLTWQSF